MHVNGGLTCIGIRYYYSAHNSTTYTIIFKNLCFENENIEIKVAVSEVPATSSNSQTAKTMFLSIIM